MLNRADFIAQHFDYLITEYGFQITEKEFNLDAMGNAYVIFVSSKLGIEVTIDRNDVLIALGNRSDPRQEWFEFSDVLKYFAPSIENVYEFPEKTKDNTWDEIIDKQLNRLAAILHQYCEQLLAGKIWKEDEFRKNEKKRVAEALEKFKKRN